MTIAEEIGRAMDEGRLLAAADFPIDPADAYGIQEQVFARRLDRGERVVGWKLGYTSAVMREQMGIAECNLAPLTEHMLLPDGAVLPAAVVQPRVEPEIALVLGRDVAGFIPVEEIDEAVAEARAALEIVDSVWLDYRCDWAQNTAAHSSAAYVAIGPVIAGKSLRQAPVTLRCNGQVVGEGMGSDAMGDPRAALSWLTARLAERGDTLHAGDVVITGGLTRAMPIEPGDVMVGSIAGFDVTVRR